MKIQSRFENGRILKKVRPFSFIAIALFANLGVWAADTIEGRINRVAFPLARYASDYVAVPKEIESEIRAKMEAVLVPIRVAPEAWFRASFGIVPAAADRRRILESVGETEIWKCLGRTCPGCPADSPMGCVRARPATGGIGVVALIHPCLVGEGGCPKGERADAAAWMEKVVAGVVFHKAAVPEDRFKKSMKASSAWIADTSRSVNRLLAACPGPYAADSMKFLLSIDTVSEPNPALRKCGSKYLEELRALPGKCPKIRAQMSEEWDAYAKKYLGRSIDVLRCDSRCRKLLCRSAAAKTVFTTFSARPTLLLADGACEGEKPLDLEGSLRDALPRALRTRISAYGCIANTAPGSEAAGGSANGPEVKLVD
jgi:hypothetical protein